jgi:hypothetical protein
MFTVLLVHNQLFSTWPCLCLQYSQPVHTAHLKEGVSEIKIIFTELIAFESQGTRTANCRYLRQNKVARGVVVAKAPFYKPEGRGFDTWWGKFLILLNPSGRTRPWGYSALTEMSTRSIKIVTFLGSRARKVCRADKLTTISADCLDNVGSLTSHSPIGYDLLWG